MITRIPLLRKAPILLTSRVYKVTGNSMEPSFKSGEHLLVSSAAFRNAGPDRGDMVILRDPRGSGLRYFKRVIGLPGETIRLSEGLLYINGDHLNEPYLGGLPASPGLNEKEWMLDNAEFFVLGDNRTHSTDSREFGPVDAASILGKAWLRYWPTNRFGLL